MSIIPQHTIHVGNRPRGWRTVKTGLGAADGAIGADITMPTLKASAVSIGIANSIIVRVVYPKGTATITTSPSVGLIGFNEDGSEYGYLPIPAAVGLSADEVQAIPLDATNNLSDGVSRYSVPVLFLNAGYTRIAPYLTTAANTSGDETLFTLQIKPVSLEK